MVRDQMRRIYQTYWTWGKQKVKEEEENRGKRKGKGKGKVVGGMVMSRKETKSKHRYPQANYQVEGKVAELQESINT